MKKHRLKITPKQLKTHRDIIRELGTGPAIPPHAIVSEKQGETVSGWYGLPCRGNPGRMFIAITVDGGSHS